MHSGIPYPAGSTILEKRAFLEQHYDWLRKALMREPRGHKDMFGVFLTPPSSPEYDAGLIYIDGTEYSHMRPRHHRGQHGHGGQWPGAARQGRHHPHPLRDHRRTGGFRSGF
ncbi:proline racemase family protein [Achromobacter xylosoxidans]